MEHLDPPDSLIWDERRLWFEEQEARHARAGASSRLSEQACALMLDLQAVFCAGAWATVVILAAAIVETQSDRSQLYRTASARELQWLRGLRNSLLHENQGEPVLTIEDQWVQRPQWEKHARRAVSLVFQAIYPESEPQIPEAGSVKER
ncbi:hypothetical protein [Fodinicurvata fenggangensis]|uniref:hypothetical protein n=1 Tax=Fodinicurvata fenggangensis TaxID=1121830 RepID=UPI00047B243D|nr:hypothetical protein [Fodinicurvata fenggangensis]